MAQEFTDLFEIVLVRNSNNFLVLRRNTSPQHRRRVFKEVFGVDQGHDNSRMLFKHMSTRSACKTTAHDYHVFRRKLAGLSKGTKSYRKEQASKPYSRSTSLSRTSTRWAVGYNVWHICTPRTQDDKRPRRGRRTTLRSMSAMNPNYLRERSGMQKQGLTHNPNMNAWIQLESKKLEMQDDRRPQQEGEGSEEEFELLDNVWPESNEFVHSLAKRSIDGKIATDDLFSSTRKQPDERRFGCFSETIQSLHFWQSRRKFVQPINSPIAQFHQFTNYIHSIILTFSGLLAIPRQYFVTEGLLPDAYVDNPLRFSRMGFNISYVHSDFVAEGFLSAPHMHAMCLENMNIEPGDIILDIGSGSGLLTAYCAYLTGPVRIPVHYYWFTQTGHVYGVDLHDHIIEFSLNNMKKLAEAKGEYCALPCLIISDLTFDNITFIKRNCFLPVANPILYGTQVFHFSPNSV